jgi:hypothetical protein
MKGDHKFKKKPKGSTNGSYARPRVQIGFDRETIKTITSRAKQNDHSFAAEVRNLVVFALSQEESNMPDKYNSIKEVPTDLLASNVVGSLILCKGDLNKYRETIGVLIRELRGEEHPPEIKAALEGGNKRNPLGGDLPPSVDPYGVLKENGT